MNTEDFGSGYEQLKREQALAVRDSKLHHDVIPHARYLLDMEGQAIGYRLAEMFSSGVPMKWGTVWKSLATGDVIPLLDPVDAYAPEKGKNGTKKRVLVKVPSPEEMCEGCATAPAVTRDAMGTALCECANLPGHPADEVLPGADVVEVAQLVGAAGFAAPPRLEDGGPSLRNAQDDRVVRVPLDRIIESTTQPRKTYALKPLEEMAATMREVGIIQPLVARGLEYRAGESGNAFRIEYRASGGEWKPLKELTTLGLPETSPFFDVQSHAIALQIVTELPLFELIAGHRRLRSAGLAKLLDAPIIVRSLPDAEVMEIQLVENLQREDLDPIEEAEGLSLMLGMKSAEGAAKWSRESLALKLGTSVQHIHDSLRLLVLPDFAREAIQGALIGVETGKIIAKIPSAEGGGEGDYRGAWGGADVDAGGGVACGAEFHGGDADASFRYRPGGSGAGGVEWWSGG